MCLRFEILDLVHKIIDCFSSAVCIVDRYNYFRLTVYVVSHFIASVRSSLILLY